MVEIFVDANKSGFVRYGTNLEKRPKTRKGTGARKKSTSLTGPKRSLARAFQAERIRKLAASGSLHSAIWNPILATYLYKYALLLTLDACS